MNKKYIILLIVFVFILIGVLIFRDQKNNKNESNEYKIQTYESDIVCKLEVPATEEDDAYTSNVFIYKNGEYVKKVIYQNITYTKFVSSYADLMKSFYDMYKGLDGISTSIFNGDEFVVSTITYEYDKMNSSDIYDKVGTILEDDSILLKKNYNFKIDWYTNEYLSEYECEVK